MKQCNYCANRECRRPSANIWPKFKFKPTNKWDYLDRDCPHYQPIKPSTQKLQNHARLTVKG